MFEKMFLHQGKLARLVGEKKIETYKMIYAQLKEAVEQQELPLHPDYLCGNDLANSIYKKKYFLKDINGELIEKRPEDVFCRISSFVASQETTKIKQKKWAEEFYKDLYEGYWMPGGRVLAGAGDLYRLKTLANCFVTKIEDDDIEAIYKAAAECARTYSYGGGIGVDITPLRPRGSIVHNAADTSTGAVSFMELYSMTTGLIGQSGRRGALMLTIDIKHPDIFHFLNVKKTPNWVSQQIVEQCRWSGKFDEPQLDMIKKQVVENTQIRFANISVKVTDEFMKAVKEEKLYGRDRIIVYRKKNKERLMKAYQKDGYFYSLGIPNKDIRDYEELQVFDSYALFSQWMEDQFGQVIPRTDLMDAVKRDVFGDYLLDTGEQDSELAIHYTGDFLLYFASDETREIRELVKARDVWDTLIESNYRTAEPGLMFWSKMSEYSPSNYVGRPIICTNPCAEVPLEDGGACNLGSINLARFVKNGFMDSAAIEWDILKKAVYNLVRFLDNVVSWNQSLNPLEKQRDAAGETRRLGVGIMGIADMLYQLKVPYDSPEGVELMDKVMKFINDQAYMASSMLAKEKAPSDIFEYEDYARGPFFREALSEEVKEHIKQHGIRNIAITSIAPTGTISNIIRSVTVGKKNYIGVSGGVEPVFALFYTRRAESFDNQLFKVFHSSVQAYIDLYELSDKVADIQTEDDLRKFLPDPFFRTAHHISPDKRIEIQSVCQKYVDHSISSTINLSEDIEPEVISNIYLKAWEQGLKGVTVYRDGSRFPILTADNKPSEFQAFKEKKFEVEAGQEKRVFFGDEVMRMPDGTLTTPFHYFRELGIKNNQDIEVV